MDIPRSTAHSVRARSNCSVGTLGADVSPCPSGVVVHCESRAGKAFLDKAFPTLPDVDRLLLLSRFTEVRFDRGEFVFFQGSRHHGNFLIRSGALRTFYLSPTGKEITLEYWRGGDFLGGPDFFDDTATHVWSAEAIERTIAWRISGAQLADVTALSPAIAAFIMQMMVLKLRLVSSVIQMLSNPSLRTRLAQLLVKLARSHGERTPDGIVIERQFTQNELANMVGATRQKVSTALSRLRRDNILRVTNRRLLIVNLAHLERLAAGACDLPPDPGTD